MALLRKDCPAFFAALSGRVGSIASGRKPKGRGRSALRVHRLARGEIDLDSRAARVEKEQLPEPSRVTVLRQPPQVVFDSARLELSHVGRRIRAPKSNMIEHAAPLRNGRPFHDMQHGLAVIVEPGAGKREGRARTGRESENVVVEGDRLFGVRREDGEMIHPSDRHGSLPPWREIARALSPPQTRRLSWRLSSDKWQRPELTA